MFVLRFISSPRGGSCYDTLPQGGGGGSSGSSEFPSIWGEGESFLAETYKLFN